MNALPLPPEDSGFSSTRRRRCEVSPGGVACTYCIGHGNRCSRNSPAPAAQHPRRSERVVAPATRHAVPTLPPQSLCLELVELYFDLIHDQFHSLFHHPTFVENVKQGRVSPIILYGMMALSARCEDLLAGAAAQ